MDEPLCFVHFINASTCFHTESDERCSGEGATEMPGGCSALPTFIPWEGQREVNGVESLGSQGSDLLAVLPGLAQFQAFGIWRDRGGHLLGGHRRTRKLLLRDRNMLKRFPESRSWSWNWKWQVELPLPTNHPSWGCEWNRDIKTTWCAGWRSKRGGFKSTRRQFGKVKFRISFAGLYVGVHKLL